MPDSGAEAIALLEATWSGIDELCATLDPDDWRRPTECPGWTVQDNLAHVIGLELVLEGEADPPRPYAEGDVPDHVRNDLGATNEAWVASFRDRSGPEVLTAFREVTARRLRSLAALGPEAWEEAWPTPAGVQPYRDFMGLRCFDAWSHEQDIRRAVDRPGGWTGPAAEHSLAHLLHVLPFIVGKRAGAPDGTTVVLRLTDQVEREAAVRVEDGRATPVTAPAGSAADVVLELPAETFVRLVLGRVDPATVLDAGAVSVEGDTELADRIVRALPVVV